MKGVPESSNSVGQGWPKGCAMIMEYRRALKMSVKVSLKAVL